MISKKGKRPIEYNKQMFYWYVKTDNIGIKKIHILSEDKQVQLQYSFFDSEIPVTSSYIRHLLDNYYSTKS